MGMTQILFFELNFDFSLARYRMCGGMGMPATN
jgi:hypothetical protein